MTPIVIADGVSLPIMIMIMIVVMAFLAAMVMVVILVGARLPKAGDHSAKEADTRCSAGG